MGVIKRIRNFIEGWRQKIYDYQYYDGYEWARQCYYDNRLPIRELLEAAIPVTGAFDRGVLQAVIDIERCKINEQQFNQKNEPVGVPYFVEDL